MSRSSATPSPRSSIDTDLLEEIGLLKLRRWSTRLCECSTVGDFGIAGFVALCEPCAAGALARALPAGSHPLAGRPAAAAVAYALGVGCCACGHTASSFRGPMHFALRMQMRRTLGIEGDPWHDLLLTWLCPQLALCQELREAARASAAAADDADEDLLFEPPQPQTARRGVVGEPATPRGSLLLLHAGGARADGFGRPNI